MVPFSRDPIKKVRKAKDKAARLAANATHSGDAIVTVRLWSKDPMLAGALDDAMESRGYRFKGWVAPKEVVYRRATKEIEREHQLKAATIYEASATIIPFADEQSKAADYTLVRVTSDEIAIGLDPPTLVPMNKVTGYCLEERDDSIPSRYIGAIIADVSYEGQPPPLACVVALHDDKEEHVHSMDKVSAFARQMRQLEIEKVRTPLGVTANSR